MTELEHLSSLVERSINHKICHSVQVIFLTVILRVKQVEKGSMKLEICSYQHSLDDVLGNGQLSSKSVSDCGKVFINNVSYPPAILNNFVAIIKILKCRYGI